MKTPVLEPARWRRVQPASSMAISVQSNTKRCWGSMVAASISLIPKILWSNSSHLSQRYTPDTWLIPYTSRLNSSHLSQWYTLDTCLIPYTLRPSFSHLSQWYMSDTLADALHIIKPIMPVIVIHTWGLVDTLYLVIKRFTPVTMMYTLLIMYSYLADNLVELLTQRYTAQWHHVVKLLTHDNKHLTYRWHRHWYSKPAALLEASYLWDGH